LCAVWPERIGTPVAGCSSVRMSAAAMKAAYGQIGRGRVCAYMLILLTAGDGDALCVGGALEFKGRGLERRRRVPGQNCRVLRLRVVIARGDDDFSRRRLVAASNPDLPVDVVLPERVLVAVDAFDACGADVISLVDRGGVCVRRAPVEQIRKR